MKRTIIALVLLLGGPAMADSTVYYGSPDGWVTFRSIDLPLLNAVQMPQSNGAWDINRGTTPSVLTIMRPDNTAGVVIHPDGSVEYYGTPNEAAKAFWNAVQAVGLNLTQCKAVEPKEHP